MYYIIVKSNINNRQTTEPGEGLKSGKLTLPRLVSRVVMFEAYDYNTSSPVLRGMELRTLDLSWITILRNVDNLAEERV